MSQNDAIIAQVRRQFHAALISTFVLSVSEDGVPSNADKANAPSLEIA